MLNFGMSHAEFQSGYFERGPLLRTGALQASVMQWQDLDALLHDVEVDERLVQMFRDGQLANDQYAEEVFEFGRRRKRISKPRFYSLMSAGATLVLNRIEDQSVIARRLCLAVSRFSEQPATSNAYVSFTGSGSFGCHWDTHDVFAIQLIGRKRWKIYAPTFPLPMSHHTSQQQNTRPERLVLDCVLEAGDLLYIPRGWWHEVEPMNTGSLHLSVGTYASTLSDYVLWTCTRQLPQLLAARHAFHAASISSDSLEGIMRDLTQQVLASQNVQGFVLEMQARQNPATEFNTAMVLNGLTPSGEEWLTRASTQPLPIVQGEVLVPGGRLKMDALSTAILHCLDQHDGLCYADLQARIPGYSAVAIQQAVLALSAFNLVNIQQAPPA